MLLVIPIFVIYFLLRIVVGKAEHTKRLLSVKIAGQVNGAIVMADVDCKSVIIAGSVNVKSVSQYFFVDGYPAKAIMSRLQKSFEY